MCLFGVRWLFACVATFNYCMCCRHAGAGSEFHITVYHAQRLMFKNPWPNKIGNQEYTDRGQGLIYWDIATQSLPTSSTYERLILENFPFQGNLSSSNFFRASNLKMPTMMWNNPCQCFMLMFLDWQYCLNATKLTFQYCNDPAETHAISLTPVNNNEDAGFTACCKESTWWTEPLTLWCFKFRGTRCSWRQGISPAKWSSSLPQVRLPLCLWARLFFSFCWSSARCACRWCPEVFHSSVLG